MQIIKSSIKVLFVSVFFLFSSFSTPALAVDSKGVVVATVNINSASIVHQESNTINGIFAVSNGKGAQSDLQYGVSLVAKTAKGDFVVDEKVFDEKINLAENVVIPKSFSYTAPANLTGTYQLLLSIKNQNNFPFAYYSFDDIKLSASEKGVVVSPESCSANLDQNTKKYNLNQTIEVFSNKQKINVTCLASNTSDSEVLYTPTFKTNLYSSYGKIAETPKVENKSISFKPNEKKNISFTVSVADKPQTYLATIYLASENNNSNSIFITYLLRGVSGTISNLSLDKDYYKKGETAKVSLVWRSSANKKSVSAILTGSSGLKCAKPLEQEIQNGTLEISIPVTSNCKNPSISVSLKDGSGAVLDQKDFSIKTPSSSDNKNILPTVLIALIVLLIAGIYLRKHKHGDTSEQKPQSISMKAILPIILLAGLGALTPFSSASADNTVYTSGPGGVIQTIATVSPTTYSANNSVRISWEVYNSSQTLNFPVMLRATNDLSGSGQANQQADLFPITTLNAGFRIQGSNQNLFTTPSATGTYAINFETGVDNPAPAATAVSYINAASAPGQAGVHNNNVHCGLTISNPGNTGNVTIQYNYSTSDRPTISYTDICSFYVNGTDTSYEDYPGKTQAPGNIDVTVNSFCLSDSDIQIDPSSVTHC